MKTVPFTGVNGRFGNALRNDVSLKGPDGIHYRNEQRKAKGGSVDNFPHLLSWRA